MAKSDASTSYLNDITRIPAGCVLAGNLRCEGDARIDGTVEGNVYSKGKIILGEKSSVKGNICASLIEIAGTITGETCSSELALRSTAVFTGNCRSCRISVDMGAVFNAAVSMISAEEYGNSADSFLKEMEK